jgi:hypothetical protein
MLGTSYQHPTWKTHGKPCSDCLNMFLAHGEFEKCSLVYLAYLFFENLFFCIETQFSLEQIASRNVFAGA